MSETPLAAKAPQASQKTATKVGTKTGPKNTPKRKPPTAAQKRVRHLVRTGWLSDQHGAWAMMAVPLFVGSSLGGFSWPQAVLTVAWLSAFFFFNVLGLWVKARGRRPATTEAAKARRRKRQATYLPAMATYAAIAAVGAGFLIVYQPSLLWWGLAFLVVFPIAVGEMWVGRDRSFLARASAIVASSFMTPIAFSLGTHPQDWTRTWVATIILILYFIGTIPYVKAMIRERNVPAWRHFCTGYHAALVVISAGLAAFGLLSWWVVGMWLVLAVRAYVYPLWSLSRPHGLRPAVIGFSEFAFSIMVVLVLLLPATLT